MRVIFCIITVALALLAEAGTALLPMVPIPESNQSLDYTIAMPSAGQGVIVVADTAAEPVHYAAERLQRSLERLTGVRYEITGTAPEDMALTIILAAENGAPQSLDGFNIAFEKGSPQIVRITGDNPRSAIYGQDALLNLLERNSDDTFGLRAANICDQATLRLRSFAHNKCDSYSPEVLDALVDARLNCIELRDGPSETLRGHFGYPVNWQIPLEPAQKLMADARRRGMYVWGVVCCGVADEDADKVLAHYETLIQLGVDGLYISFDDPGTKGDAVALVTRILKLAKERGFSDDDIAFLPPAPDYDLVVTEFNRNMAEKVPGLANVRWYFTAVPSEAQQYLIDKMNLSHARGWWMNWPMGNSAAVLPAYWFEESYICVPDFTDTDQSGEHPPEVMRRAGKYIDSAMVWVRNYPEYLGQLFGVWAWNPERFDGMDAKERIYSRVYGREMANKALRFDSLLIKLKSHMTRIGQFNWNQCIWFLNWYGDVAWSNEVLADLHAIEAELAANAPRYTLLEPKRLQDYYLTPMQRTLNWIDMIVNTEFPERVHPHFDRDANWERDHGTLVPYLNHWRERMEPMLQVIEERFRQSEYTKGYVEGWRKKLTLPPDVQ